MTNVTDRLCDGMDAPRDCTTRKAIAPRQCVAEPRQHPHQFWDWELKHRVYLSSANYEGYAIEYEQITQGLMLIETRGHRSQFEPHRTLVYVHSLASAPWNRPSLQPAVEFRAIGRIPPICPLSQ